MAEIGKKQLLLRYILSDLDSRIDSRVECVNSEPKGVENPQKECYNVKNCTFEEKKDGKE